MLSLFFLVEPAHSFRIENPSMRVQFVLRVAMGLVICFVGLDRRVVRESLKDSAQRTQPIVDTALDAVIGINRQGAITEWNPRAEVMFGWRRAEALGRELAELVIPERYREPHRRGMRRLLETGVANVLDKRIELSAIRRDGSEFPIELSITRIRYAGEEYFSGFVRDISARKAAEAELRASEARLRTLAAAVKAVETNRPVIMLTVWGHRLRAEDEIPEFVDRVLGKPPRLRDLRTALLELTSGGGAVEPSSRNV